MTEPTVVGPSPMEFPSGWVAYIEPFAKAIGKDVTAVTELLKPISGEPGDMAIEILKDATASPDSDIKATLIGTPSGVANKAIKLLRGAPQMTQATAAAFGAMQVSEILPAVPTEESWLSSLRAGGVLKVSPTTVNSAIRAMLAYRAGLYDVPDLLVQRMEQFADQNAEAVGAQYFKLRKELKRRDYADIFEAIEGLDGTYVTEARKKELYKQIDDLLMPAIVSFQTSLSGWVEGWQKSAGNPAIMMQAMAAMMTGSGVGVVPPGMMQAPDTGVLRDEADAVSDTINKVFAGTRMPIASALAYEAAKIKKTLEESSLPMYMGAANREQMLRMLGVDIAATYPRMETNLIKYVLSIIKIKDLAAGNDEVQFFGALYMLGTQIPWDQLSIGRGAFRTRSNSDVSESGRANVRRVS